MHKGARTDPCGGRGVTRAPTATRRIISLTFFAFSALLDEAERATIPPRDGNGFVDQAGGEDDGQVGSSVEAHRNLGFGDGDVGRHVDEVAEDLTRLSIIVAAHAVCHQAIEA